MYATFPLYFQSGTVVEALEKTAAECCRIVEFEHSVQYSSVFKYVNRIALHNCFVFIELLCSAASKHLVVFNL